MKILGKNLFIKKAKEKHKNKYDYSKVIYKNNYTKVKILCPIHGLFYQTPKIHYNHGCFKCSILQKVKNDFKELAIKIHKNKYNYSKVKYINRYLKISIICSKHGEFKQSPKSHLKGRGCPRCYHESPRYNTKGIDKFIEQANLIHNFKFDYSQSKYINNKKKLTIICKTHGKFKLTPASHLNGANCPDCSGYSKLNKKSFIKRARSVHGNKYNYSKVKYTKCYYKVSIICPKHGKFLQAAQDHLSGHGCAKCSRLISKSEIKWLNSIGVPNKPENRNVLIKINNKKYKVDGYYKGIVYEFYGDFWHGNPKVFDSNKINKITKLKYGQMYTSTLKRELLIKQAGYKVISIWEHDWKKLNKY